MILSGFNSVSEFIKSGNEVKQVFVEKGKRNDNIYALCNEKEIEVKECSREEMYRLTGTSKHQGVAASCRDFVYSSIEDILAYAKEKKEEPFILIAEYVEDPQNLGSIIRSAECAGVHGIIIPKDRSSEVTPTVIRVASGAAAHVKIAKVTNINDAIRKLKNEFIRVYAADMDGESVYSADFKSACAVLVGGEGTGVRPLSKKLSDGVIALPQKGKINSLNVAVASAIVLYEAVRQRS